MMDTDDDRYYDDAYLVSYQLDKENSLLDSEDVAPKHIIMNTSTLGSVDNFTGEVSVDEDLNLEITAVTDDNDIIELAVPKE